MVTELGSARSSGTSTLPHSAPGASGRSVQGACPSAGAAPAKAAPKATPSAITYGSG